MYFAAGNRLIPVPGRVESSSDRKGSRSGLCFSIRRSTGKKMIQKRIITDKFWCVLLKKTLVENILLLAFQECFAKICCSTLVSKTSEQNIYRKSENKCVLFYQF
jgi:hypothetical protein